MSDRPSRTYSSPLRESQARRTRDLILDALTELLGERSADEITTREIADRAGVSQPTVYRHFPDRTALLEGLTGRIVGFMDAEGDRGHPKTIDDLAALATRGMSLPEQIPVEATAEALLNADPRRLSQDSRERSAELLRVVGESLPEYGDRDHLRITALLRILYSIQTWLRMREEFGIHGDESGPIVGWAVDTLVREIRAGNFPRDGGPGPGGDGSVA
jgi:AcrR family transcriptional regulator